MRWNELKYGFYRPNPAYFPQIYLWIHDKYSSTSFKLYLSARFLGKNALNLISLPLQCFLWCLFFDDTLKKLWAGFLNGVKKEFTKPRSKTISFCPMFLSKHHLSRTISWKHIGTYIFQKIKHQERDLEVQRFLKPRRKIDFALLVARVLQFKGLFCFSLRAGSLS